MIAKFHKLVECGPLYICSCCNQLWYKESVVQACNLNMEDDLKLKVCTKTVSAENKEWICGTCSSYIKRKCIPPLSAYNLKFPEKPPCLHLTNLEERLISPRIPFMMLHELPRGGQISINGNVVNVPSDINTTVTHLPRSIDDSSTVALKLKRKLSYKHHITFQNVRPNLVRNALQFLVTNSSLYREEGITVDEDWDAIPTSKQDEKKEENINSEEKDDWDERDLESMPGGTIDTMLQPQDILSDESSNVLCFAPAEGNTPVSIFTDKYSEELAFPTIYCGQKRDFSVKISYNDICKSELRRSDRRAAGHIPNIFFKLKKLQAKHIHERANVALRKTKGNVSKTAGDLKSADQLVHLIRHDEGYKILKDLRGSPPYWEKTKKDLFAMLRILGIPTWFMSFSSAETRWLHLLKILSETVHGKKVTSEEVLNMTFFEKSELIRKDPVTCSQHFQHQVKKMISTILQAPNSPVAQLQDFFYKVEFQMRGSPHIHMLVWIKGAPTMENTDDTFSKMTIIEFIDTHTTCKRDPSIEDLVQLQEHKHSRTCKKKGENICRFQFPLPPMPETCIMEPLEQTVSTEEKQKNWEHWKCITKKLNDLRNEKQLSMTFEEFLQSLQLTEHQYMMSVRSSITRKQVFLKRDVHETRINSYNKILLQCWRANIDIQFVLDPYACAIYIVTYIAKSQRGMSNLLHEAVRESKEGNDNLRHQVKTIGHKFLNHVEISAQEAVYFILQMPLKQSSREVVFVNTSPPDERVVILKSFTAMKNIDNDSTDVTTKNLLQRYSERPTCLENTCLADFASHYKIIYRSSKHTPDTDTSSDDEEMSAESNCFKMSDGNTLKKRRHTAIIRYVRYQQSIDQENYFREILMLFYPWRTEASIISKSETFTERYIAVVKDYMHDIQTKMNEYNHQFAELDQALQDIENLNPELIAHGWNNVHPQQHATEEEDCTIGQAESDEYQSLAPQSDIVRQYSEFNQDTAAQCEQRKNYLPDSNYMSLARKLNTKQRQFFLHVLHHFKTREEPLYLFLSGGAGVGKTMVVTVLYQALIRWFNSKPEANPDNSKVLLAAPTGKAAYLIKGNTLHSLLHIPANQGFEYTALKSDTLNTFRKKFADVKLLIIDEISMVGNRMLNYINKRLQQIMGTSRLFGGVSVLAVGDLFQLKPVFDGWIFQMLKDDYGPLALNIWIDNFRMFELEEIMRQKESKLFAKLLNRLRENKHTKEDIKTLKQQEISTDMLHPEYPLETPHIYMRNADVDNHNTLACDFHRKSHFLSNTLDVVLGDVAEDIKAEIISKVPKDTAKTMGLATQVKTAIGLRNELSCNVDVDDGLANGASFVMVDFGPQDQHGNYKYIWAKFDDKMIGQQCREKRKACYSDTICKTWTPLMRIKRQFPIGRYKNVLVLRSQFPFRCAVAKSCHRCQGDTMESAVVDFSGRCFPHSHYVALSRVTNIQNLKIRTLNESKIHIDKNVQLEMQRLRLSPSLHTQPTIAAVGSFLVLYHNVRSQQKHFEDILTSEIYQEANINIFSETKLNDKIDSQNLQLPNYTLRRYDSNNRTYGLAFYAKNNTELTPVLNNFHCKGKEYIEFAIVEVQTRLSHIPVLTVGAVYISPKVSPQQLKLFLQNIYQEMSARNQPFILLGDFNVDILNKPNTYLMEILHCKQGIQEVTTDHKSLLDHIYVSEDIPSYQCYVSESYFSDHKAVIISLK